MTDQRKGNDIDYVTRMKRMTPDEAAKRLFSHPEVFAELFNYLLFKGEKVLKPENLTPLPTESIVNEKGNADTRIRDILKKAIIKEDGHCCFVLLGVEHQSKADEFMIQRVLNYNARNMLLQAEKAKPGEKIIPIITGVFHSGSTKWSYPLNLYSTMDIPFTLMPYMRRYEPDRKYLLADPAGMSKRQLQRTGEIFAKVAKCVRYQNNPIILKKILENTEMERVPDDAFWAIKIFTKDDNLEYNSNGDKTVNMCYGTNVIFKERDQKKKEEGWIESKVDSVRGIMNYFGISADEAMKASNVSQAERNAIRSMLQKSLKD